ncbi:hypothetical protein [Coleofasciculus chthonoplastes]|nr:hypothetical protein [Coleofasciculus chthonoplastes]
MDNIQSEIRPSNFFQTPKVARIIATNSQSSIQVSQANMSTWIGFIVLLLLVGLPIVIIYQSTRQSRGKRSHSRFCKNGNRSYSSGGSDWQSDSSWDNSSSSSAIWYSSSDDCSSSSDSNDSSSSGDSYSSDSSSSSDFGGGDSGGGGAGGDW